MAIYVLSVVQQQKLYLLRHPAPRFYSHGGGELRKSCSIKNVWGPETKLGWQIGGHYPEQNFSLDVLLLEEPSDQSGLRVIG